MSVKLQGQASSFWTAKQLLFNNMHLLYYHRKGKDPRYEDIAKKRERRLVLQLQKPFEPNTFASSPLPALHCEKVLNVDMNEVCLKGSVKPCSSLEQLLERSPGPNLCRKGRLDRLKGKRTGWIVYRYSWQKKAGRERHKVIKTKSLHSWKVPVKIIHPPLHTIYTTRCKEICSLSTPLCFNSQPAWAKKNCLIHKRLYIHVLKLQMSDITLSLGFQKLLDAMETSVLSPSSGVRCVILLSSGLVVQ